MQSKRRVLIGLGSNLNQPKQQIKTAITALAELPQTDVLKSSSLYKSLPQGPQDQDSFINAVVLIETDLAACDLLLKLQDIEAQQGRIKTRHWGERCIDLDILFIENETHRSSSPDLTVPHPYALQRDFVVEPCLEICPDWLLPSGEHLHDYQEHCVQHNLSKI